MTIEECIENYEETGNTEYYTYVDNIRVDLTLVWQSFRVTKVYSIYGESVDASDNNLTLAIKAQDLDTWSCS